MPSPPQLRCGTLPPMLLLLRAFLGVLRQFNRNESCVADS